MATVITNHIDNAGLVRGSHGGAGAMTWVRLATGSHLHGDWDGVEWVSIEPRGRVGRHTHSHTDEMWFVLGGQGVLEIDGEHHDLSPGTIVLTPLHSSHASWNTGEDPLHYIVIEVFPPAISSALPPRSVSNETE